MQFHAPPAEGLELTLVMAGAGDTVVRAMDGSDGLEDLPGFDPRPVDVGIAGSHTAELVVVARDYPLRP